jgi:hypothetical protein
MKKSRGKIEVLKSLWISGEFVEKIEKIDYIELLRCIPFDIL